MIAEIIGLVGMFLILSAFILNQVHIWKDTYLKYDIFNAVGSLLLIIYSALILSYPFLILNLVWFVVSIRDVIFDVNKIEKKKTHVGHKKR